jgi:hypothetical protein
MPTQDTPAPARDLPIQQQPLRPPSGTSSTSSHGRETPNVTVNANLEGTYREHDHELLEVPNVRPSRSTTRQRHIKIDLGKPEDLADGSPSRMAARASAILGDDGETDTPGSGCRSNGAGNADDIAKESEGRKGKESTTSTKTDLRSLMSKIIAHRWFAWITPKLNWQSCKPVIRCALAVSTV